MKEAKVKRRTELSVFDGGCLVTYAWQGENDGYPESLTYAFTTEEEAAQDIADFYKGENDWGSFWDEDEDEEDEEE